MKTALRISYIKDIVKNLASYEWSDIDLILGQFKLPTSDSWTGSKNDYILISLKDSKDSTLKELRSYIVENQSIDNENIISDNIKIWLPNRFRLFMSHLSDDKLLVTEIKQKLMAYGIDCFVAHEDINPALEWQNVIESSLQSCDAMAALLTKKFHDSDWTDQEIGFCVARRVLIIPLKVDKNPYGFIGKYQAQNCDSLNHSKIAEKIFNILINSPLTSAKLSEAIVADFVESGNWEAAKTRSLLLKKIKVWTPELLRSIENSLEVNSQISGSFGVPERIRSILAEHSK